MPYEGAGFTIKLTKYGGPDATRTRYLLLARQVLSQLSYWPKYRTFNWPPPVNFVVTAASLNLYHFIRIGSLHSVHSGLCSLILRVIGPLH